MTELLMPILIAAGFGIIGGAARVLIDMLKMSQVKSVIGIHGFALYAFVAIVTGSLAGILFDYGRLGSAIAGYAGLDIMDGIYSQFKKTNIEVKRKK